MHDIKQDAPLGEKEVRLLLVDVHAISRDSSRILLNALPGLRVVGQSSEHQEALELTRRLKPDVAIMGMRVAGSTGPETAREILKAEPQTRIVFLTLFDDPEYIKAALDAGAHGYVLKQEPAVEILNAITTVIQGKQYLSPTLQQKL
jgi:DNA-binding NarL/FixJ family response regulator